MEFAGAFFAVRAMAILARLLLMAAGVAIRSAAAARPRAALRSVAGIADMMKMHGALARRFTGRPSRLLRSAVVNCGLVTVEARSRAAASRRSM